MRLGALRAGGGGGCGSRFEIMIFLSLLGWLGRLGRSFEGSSGSVFVAERFKKVVRGLMSVSGVEPCARFFRPEELPAFEQPKHQQRTSDDPPSELLRSPGK